ncbi:hypothetical protein A3715_19025 [Oleiphilus sp. HI0009]|nr:hypothetical protein A3715_19025 [Oleiphilus sp. HI0009]
MPITFKTQEEKLASFEDYAKVSRNEYLKEIFLASIVSFVFYAIFDYYFYPEHFWDLALARIAYLSVAILTYLRLDPKKDDPHIITYWMGFIGTVALCSFSVIVDDPFSPYVMSVIVIVLCYALLINSKPYEILLYIATVFVIYGFAYTFLMESKVDYKIFTFTFFLLVVMAYYAHVQSSYLTSTVKEGYLLQLDNDEYVETLQKKNADLQALDKVKTDFLSSMTHEIHTPLSIMTSPIDDLLRNTPNLDHRVRNHLMTSQQEGKRLIDFVDNVLKASKAQNNTLAATNKKTVFDLNEALRSIISSFEEIFRQSGIDLIYQDPDCQVPIEADVSQIEGVFYNLIGNAQKFNSVDGNVIITLDIIEPNTISVVVKDDGVGMTQDQKDHVFEMFSTFHPNKGSNVGLGLYLVKSFIDLNNGDISVHSGVGEGTKFTITFDLSQKELDHRYTSTLSIANSERVTVRPLSHSSGKASVLVVDDEPNMLSCLQSVLDGYFNVFTAPSFDRAINLSNSINFDVAILDFRLEDHDGLLLSKTIKSIQPNIKTILLTAETNLDFSNYEDSLFVDHISYKPFNANELRDSISKLSGIEINYSPVTTSNTSAVCIFHINSPNLEASLVNVLKPLKIDGAFCNRYEAINKYLNDVQPNILFAEIRSDLDLKYLKSALSNNSAAPAVIVFAHKNNLNHDDLLFADKIIYSDDISSISSAFSAVKASNEQKIISDQISTLFKEPNVNENYNSENVLSSAANYKINELKMDLLILYSDLMFNQETDSIESDFVKFSNFAKESFSSSHNVSYVDKRSTASSFVVGDLISSFIVSIGNSKRCPNITIQTINCDDINVSGFATFVEGVFVYIVDRWNKLTEAESNLLFRGESQSTHFCLSMNLSTCVDFDRSLKTSFLYEIGFIDVLKEYFDTSMEISFLDNEISLNFYLPLVIKDVLNEAVIS